MAQWLFLVVPGVPGHAELPAPEPLQHRPGSKPVGHLADGRLELAQRVAGLAAEPAVRFAHIEAALGEMLLQLVALRAREHALVPRPGLRERLPAAQPVADIADGERIGLGRIVFDDRAEI